MSKPKPNNTKLYEKVRKDADKIFKVHSAYKSGWIVREYKKKGGKYSGKKTDSNGISRWFKEKWINICKLPKIVPCGRSKATVKNYPYCRPTIRVNKSTPKTWKELTKTEIKKRCIQKKKSPYKNLIPKSRRKKSAKKSRRKKSAKKSRRKKSAKKSRRKKSAKKSRRKKSAKKSRRKKSKNTY